MVMKPSDYGLNDQEYQQIITGLKREPNHVELGIFSALWSEHCSYKHTRSLLKQLPTEAAWVVQGPGENAGVVALDENWAVVFKVESHNHPSFVAPYDGAATGVGGLVRDVMAMGARPVGVKALLRAGSLDDPRTRAMVDEIKRGAAEYARNCGLQLLGVELLTHPSYATNPLVNVIVVGVVHRSRLMTSGAGKVGNLLLYYGIPTGASGVDGAAFASKGMDENTVAHPPSGDANIGKDLMLATLELIEQNAIVGLQDMGAAGLTSSSFEMVHRAGHGLWLDLDAVPKVSDKLTAYELMLSETQERMLAAVDADKLAAAQKILEKYPSLQVKVIGKVVDGDTAVIQHHNQPAATLPMQLVVDGFPRLTISGKADADQTATHPLEMVESTNYAVTVTGDSIYPSQLSIQLDGAVPGECCEIRFPQIGKTILLRTLANGTDILKDAYQSVYNIVKYACRDLKDCGAKPLALSDGLNFGSPDNPFVAWQITEGMRGLADACRDYSVPVIGGNVSLYNETRGNPILGQLFIGVVGVKSED